MNLRWIEEETHSWWRKIEKILIKTGLKCWCINILAFKRKNSRRRLQDVGIGLEETGTYFWKMNYQFEKE